MHAALYELLKQYARAGETHDYSDVAPTAGVVLDKDYGWVRLGEMLGEISRYEVHAGRPMLSAVVVRRGDGMPGGGFFTEAAGLGLYRGTTNMEQLEFYAAELGRVFEYWRSHPE